MLEAPGGSPDREKFYPIEENLGKNCVFWCLGGQIACGFPKVNLEGRTKCEGMIDDVCLYIKDGRQPSSLTEEQIIELKTRAPGLLDKSYIPPGDIV